MKKNALSVITAVGFLSLSNNTIAENGHAYNGSYCKARFGNEANYFRHDVNGIKNVSAGARYISCPVVVDEIGPQTGTSRVRVYYTGPLTIQCILASMRYNGTVLQSRRGSRQGTGWFSIPNITADDFWGSYAMECLLPAGGTLNTVWVGENS